MAVITTLVLVLIIALIITAFYRYYGSRAERYAYPSRLAYMRAVPKSDEEKQEAVDQTSLGLAICLVGMLLPPILLVGITPFIVGGRKTTCALMGLGYVDDGDQSSS